MGPNNKTGVELEKGVSEDSYKKKLQFKARVKQTDHNTNEEVRRHL